MRFMKSYSYFKAVVDKALLELGHDKPKSVYADGWLGHKVPTLEVEGHIFEVQPTNLMGCDTLRTRYQVKCLTCSCTVHEATTGPRPNIAHHLVAALLGRFPKKEDHMGCQKCKSEKILRFSGKVSDLFNWDLPDREGDGYVPKGIGLGGGDYVKGDLCLDCGQLQGEWPQLGPEEDL
jgi:hypothetical protein